MASTIFTMLCASAVGSYIDRAPSRLSPLLSLITINHGAIAAAYGSWLFWPLIAGETGDSTSKGPFSSPVKGFLFGFLVLLDVVQDLSVMGNRLSVERDWVSALVGPITDTESSYTLTQVNSVLKRIDLITKLVAPSLLPLIVALFHSRNGWINLLGGLTVCLPNGGLAISMQKPQSILPNNRKILSC
jgi:iron-regulated transporter 1